MAREQAQKWWDLIGVAMIDRGEITAKMKSIKDVFVRDADKSHDGTHCSDWTLATGRVTLFIDNGVRNRRSACAMPFLIDN